MEAHSSRLLTTCCTLVLSLVLVSASADRGEAQVAIRAPGVSIGVGAVDFDPYGYGLGTGYFRATPYTVGLYSRGFGGTIVDPLVPRYPNYRTPNPLTYYRALLDPLVTDRYYRGYYGGYYEGARDAYTEGAIRENTLQRARDYERGVRDAYSTMNERLNQQQESLQTTPPPSYGDPAVEPAAPADVPPG